MVLSIIVLLIGWALIYAGTLYEDELNELSEKYIGGKFLGEWAGTFIMTFVNYFIPWVISIVGKLEEWDFAAESLFADLWKNFYTSLLNMVFFMII